MLFTYYTKTKAGMLNLWLLWAMASPPKRGRPKDEIGFVCINLKKDVHEIWLARKESMGFSPKTHSDFARNLLLNFSEDQPKQSGVSKPISWVSKSW